MRMKIKTLEDVKPLTDGHLAEDMNIPGDVSVPVIPTHHELSIFFSLVKNPLRAFDAWLRMSESRAINSQRSTLN